VNQKRPFGWVVAAVVFAFAAPSVASGAGATGCGSPDWKSQSCGLALTKTGPAQAHVGDVITYSYSVTSTGFLAPAVDKQKGLVDDKCAPVAYVSGDTNSDGRVDSGETWAFTCKYTVKAADVNSTSHVVNTAVVTGTVNDTCTCKPVTVTATAQWSTLVVAPTSPPGGGTTPPTTTSGSPPPGVTTPGQVVAPQTTSPGQVVLGQRVTPGSARLLAPSGCISKAFNARIRGAQIVRVTFKLDGKTIKRLTKPNSSGAFSARINPTTLKTGVHRLAVSITFTSSSGTKAKTLRASFQRCAKALVSPGFTG
jgi:hypothetical protein